MYAGMNSFPCMIRSSTPAGETRYRLGDRLVESYLEFVAGRARPNTLRAIVFELKTFFAVIDKDRATSKPLWARARAGPAHNC
jgi:integrase/recombinase XerD